MKTLEQIKNEYAKEVGFDDFKSLLNGMILYNNVKSSAEKIDYILNKISIESQKECLKLASENAYTKTETNGLDGEYWDYNVVDKESITNENNIIK